MASLIMFVENLVFFQLSLSEYETSIAALLVDPLALPVSWSDIGGLDSTIAEIKVQLKIYRELVSREKFYEEENMKSLRNDFHK